MVCFDWLSARNIGTDRSNCVVTINLPEMIVWRPSFWQNKLFFYLDSFCQIKLCVDWLSARNTGTDRSKCVTILLLEMKVWNKLFVVRILLPETACVDRLSARNTMTDRSSFEATIFLPE